MTSRSYDFANPKMAVYSNQLNQTQDLLSQVSFPQNLDGKIYFSFSQVQGKFEYPLELLI